MAMSRREFMKKSGAATAGLVVATQAGWMAPGVAAPLIPKLSDPFFQPKFANLVPNALHPSFRYVPGANGEYTVGVGVTTQYTGLLNNGGNRVPTPVYGYGQDGSYSWPGKTFEIQSGAGETVVNWENNLFGATEHLLPVDKSLHWAYSLEGYDHYTIAENGIPIVVHLHGGHTDFQFDGNPEFFYSPGGAIVGPQWANVPGGFTNAFRYDNDVPAGSLWYHDHALGITRLNVYAGMAGFYFVRDDIDTGLPDNPLGLPAYPYEMALAIQDRMFKKGGKLFYPALPGDPFWDDFITGEGLQERRRPQAVGTGRVLRRSHGGQWRDLAEGRCRTTPLPAAPAQRLRQPVPGDPVPGGPGRRHRPDQRRGTAALQRDRQRPGPGGGGDPGRHPGHRAGRALRRRLRLQGSAGLARRHGEHRR